MVRVVIDPLRRSALALQSPLVLLSLSDSAVDVADEGLDANSEERKEATDAPSGSPQMPTASVAAMLLPTGFFLDSVDLRTRNSVINPSFASKDMIANEIHR